jgi:hypothetical protein
MSPKPRIFTMFLFAALLIVGLTWSAHAATVSNALDFDGVNDSVTIATLANAPLGNTARTVEAWVKVSPTFTGYGMVFAYGGAAFYERLSVGIQNGSVRVESNNSTVTWPATVNDGAWHHLAVVYAGSGGLATASVYLDGTALTGPMGMMNGSLALSTTSGPAYLGSLDGASFFLTGTIDDLRVWNVARTQAEIQAAKGTELTGIEAGLVAYYPFNQGVAAGTNTGVTTLNDLTSGASTGTLNGFALSGASSNWVSRGTTVLSTNADLSNLMLSMGTLSPTFAAGTTSYTATVLYTVTNLTVTPSLSDPNATVQVNGTSATSPITLTVGANAIPVVVTAQDGTTTKTYTVTVTRAAGSANADLSSLRIMFISEGEGKRLYDLRPPFPPSDQLTFSVGPSTVSVDIMPTAADVGATVTVRGTLVPDGKTLKAILIEQDAVASIPIVVTASDGITTRTYTLTVNANEGGDCVYDVYMAVGARLRLPPPYLESMRQIVPQATNYLSATATLYRVRDTVLASSATGKHLTDLYYAHSPELIQLSVLHPELVSEFFTVLDLWLPALDALANGQGDRVVISAAMSEGLDTYLNKLTAFGSPALQQAFTQERAQLGPFAAYVGKTMTQARGTAVGYTVYVPVIRR